MLRIVIFSLLAVTTRFATATALWSGFIRTTYLLVRLLGGLDGILERELTTRLLR